MKKTKRKTKKLRLHIKLLLLIILVVSFCVYKITLNIKMKEQIKNAKINVIMHNDLNVSVYSKVKLSELILHINGKLLKDSYIDTSKVGKQKVSFKYINDDNIEVSYSFFINIYDSVAPTISKDKNHIVEEGYKGNIAYDMFCGDNYDNKPKCRIVGEYDINTPGEYDVLYEAIDSSNNKVTHPFTMIVKKKKNTPNKTNSSTKTTKTKVSGEDFSSVYKKYKTKDNKVGIDISFWQGDINYKKVKAAGVEFVMIRLGSQTGIGKEYKLDDNFIKNVNGFKSVSIPVGVYFYSYADSVIEAKKQAVWVMNKLKDIKIDYPIAFDWENWDTFRKYNMSFYTLNNVANTFLNEIENNGYKSILYTSKAYQENMWIYLNHDVWLAHYTNDTSLDYNGIYKMWQIKEDGVIDGINSNVDIDIFYKK